MNKEELYEKLRKCPKLVLMAIIAANYIELKDYLKDNPDDTRIAGWVSGQEKVINLTSEALSE